MANDIVDIQTFHFDAAGVCWYDISVRLPLRTVSVSRRFSQFELLARDIASELGISTADLPSPLPSKTLVWARGAALAQLRKDPLARFVNSLIADLQLRHSPHLLGFLLLPPSYRFLARALRQGLDENYDLTDVVSDDSWPGIFRALKLRVLALSVHSVSSHIDAQKTAMLLLEPCLQRLRAHATSSMCDRQSRLAQIAQLDRDLKTRLQWDLPSPLPPSSLKRVFGPASTIDKEPLETAETAALSSVLLLQLQTQVQQQQDLQVDELRRMIHRQRQMGEAIHLEVLQQNELLDLLAHDVDGAELKLGRARARARNIIG